MDPGEIEVQNPVLAVKPKPAVITRAVTFFWTSFAAGVLVAALEWSSLTGHDDLGRVASVYILAFAFWCLLIFKISQGKNWARIVYLVGVLSSMLNGLKILDEFSEQPVVTIVAVLGWLLQLVALFMIFTNPGKEWFQK